MSETTPPLPPVEPPPAPSDSLRNPTFLVSLLLLGIGGGAVFGIFLKGNAEVVAGIANLVVGFSLGAVSQFYMGASKQQSAAPPTTKGTTP